MHTAEFGEAMALSAMIRDEVEWRKSQYEHLQDRVRDLEAELETLRTRCVPGAEKAFERKMYGCLKIVPVKD